MKLIQGLSDDFLIALSSSLYIFSLVIKTISLILLWLLLWSCVMILPGWAASCRTLGDRQICIVSIQRSAKNYWEYRASVQIDGVIRPIEVYNCRDRIRIRQDKTVVPFEPNGAGELICHALKTAN